MRGALDTGNAVSDDCTLPTPCPQEWFRKNARLRRGMPPGRSVWAGSAAELSRPTPRPILRARQGRVEVPLQQRQPPFAVGRRRDKGGGAQLLQAGAEHACRLAAAARLQIAKT